MLSKFYSILRWILFEIFISLCVVISYIFYPISYIFRDFIRKSRYGKNLFLKVITFPWWVLLDDDSKYDWGDDWWIDVTNARLDTKWRRFIESYKWSVLRNPAWNVYTFIKPKDGVQVIRSKSGKLEKNGTVVTIGDDPWSDFAVMKYVDINGNYTDNKGEYLSLRYSVIGKSFVWYTIDNTLYWRYSKVGKINNKIVIFLYNMISSIFKLSNQFDDKEWWSEIQLGTNTKRYTIRNKIKKINGIYEHISMND